MILSGREIVTRQLVRNLLHVAQQQQPCGVDLTLCRVSKWTSAATIDFDNTKRQAAKTCSLPFDDNNSHAITLQPGAYFSILMKRFKFHETAWQAFSLDQRCGGLV